MRKRTAMRQPKLVDRIESELLTDIPPGEIRRIRLRRGLGLAYLGDGDKGFMTLSRPGEKEPSAKEVEIIRRDFVTAAGRCHLPVLEIKELERGVMTLSEANHYVIKLVIYFGEQKGLFDER